MGSNDTVDVGSGDFEVVNKNQEPGELSGGEGGVARAWAGIPHLPLDHADEIC